MSPISSRQLLSPPPTPLSFLLSLWRWEVLTRGAHVKGEREDGGGRRAYFRTQEWLACCFRVTGDGNPAWYICTTHTDISTQRCLNLPENFEILLYSWLWVEWQNTFKAAEHLGHTHTHNCSGTLQRDVSAPVTLGWGGDINTCVRPGADVTYLWCYLHEGRGLEGRKICTCWIKFPLLTSAFAGNPNINVFKL